MLLNKLINKKNLTVIGLNSGTSADGLDLAAVRFNRASKTSGIKFIGGKTVRYPDDLSTLINEAINDKLKSIDKLIELDRRLGFFYGTHASKFCESLKKNGHYPDLIASHGQTVRHLPGKVIIRRSGESATLQLGHPETIADNTGLITVADFRQADIASGGEGAPITSWAMWRLFNSKSENRMMLNIGGIANFFLLPKNKPAEKMMAADCGPGNSLIDILSLWFFGKRFDRGGKIASGGKISFRLLSVLLADNFLKGKYGPSTGRERFGEKFAKKIVQLGTELGMKKKDILATATELTAVGIANAINKIPKYDEIKNIYLLGGGTANRFLISRLEANLPAIKFSPVNRLGFDSNYLEAACYAVMGARTIAGLTSSLGHITGSEKNCISGRIIQPSL